MVFFNQKFWKLRLVKFLKFSTVTILKKILETHII